ncbi:hypothetical protein [Pseudomonas fluorescens group sp. PF-69]
MNPKLAILQRRMNLQPEQAPVPESGHGLGVAIEQLIADEVSRRVGEAMQQSPKVQRLLDDFNRPKPTTDFKQLPPVARTPAPKAMELQFQRDELGRVAMVDAGFMQWRVQRNEVGQIVRMVPADIAPIPPAIEPPYLGKARQYQDGV